jgi:hypothetical protein
METRKNQGSPKNDSRKEVTKNLGKTPMNSKRSTSSREDEGQQRRGNPGKNVTDKDKR